MFCRKIRASLPSDIYLFKANSRNAIKRCDICSELTIKKAGKRQCLFGVYIDNFQHIASASVFDFEQVIICWAEVIFYFCLRLTWHMENLKIQ